MTGNSDDKPRASAFWQWLSEHLMTVVISAILIVMIVWRLITKLSAGFEGGFFDEDFNPALLVAIIGLGFALAAFAWGGWSARKDDTVYARKFFFTLSGLIIAYGLTVLLIGYDLSWQIVDAGRGKAQAGVQEILNNGAARGNLSGAEIGFGLFFIVCLAVIFWPSKKKGS